MLYIRTDMNNIIATGHVMRCLSIADAAKKLGEDTTFLLADCQAVDLLESRGHSYIVLNTAWNDLNSELPFLTKIIQKNSIDRLLIDTYQVTENYLRELSKIVYTVYLDDINQFIYPVNSIICYAGYFKKFNYEINYPCAELYLGPVYAPLREEFNACAPKEIKPKAEHLLLLSGGSDNFHIVDKLLAAVPKEDYSRIDAVCGKYNSDYESLCEKYKYHPNIFFHKAVSDMKTYMEQADIAVSAGGSTLYELCAVGTPAISYSFADNQLGNVTQFHEDGLIDYAGDFRTDDVAAAVSAYLKKLYKDSVLRQEKSKKMQALVDGKGAVRIARALIKESEKQ